MGNSSNEAFDDFLESLKQAGVKIDNEQELKERLAEASHWRYAFRTIAARNRKRRQPHPACSGQISCSCGNAGYLGGQPESALARF